MNPFEKKLTIILNYLTRKLGKGDVMNKDEILKMSREENEGRQDERERIAYGVASRVGMYVGAIICVAMVFVGELLLHIPEIGLVGWIVYSAMQGSGNLVLYRELNNRKNLIWGIVEIIFAVVLALTLVVKSVV